MSMIAKTAAEPMCYTRVRGGDITLQQRRPASGAWKDITRGNMYRVVFRSINAARSSPLAVIESNVLSAKCDKTAVIRLANRGRVKALCTSSFKLCEKKDDVDLNHDEKTRANVKASPTLAAQREEDGGEVVKEAKLREEPGVLQTDESTTQKAMDVNIGATEAKPKQVKNDRPKSGKESLLDLLGAMKVEVTSKRKWKILKAKHSDEFSSKLKPAAMESTISMFQKASVEASSQGETLDPELVSAASAAAATLPNSSQAKSELLTKLRQHEAITEAQKKGDMKNLEGIITDMKVGKKSNRQSTRTANSFWYDEEGGITAERNAVRRKTVLGEKRLNIFSPTTKEDGVELAIARPTLWDMEFATQLSLSINQTPRNGLEEMIQWTKEGKMWQYPVDNEAGLEEEASVPFHEHVFLDKHLMEGFPPQGPVRHFMELVVAGLCRNPYLTVQQKIQHIDWFRDYFHQKEDILKEADVHLN